MRRHDAAVATILVACLVTQNAISQIWFVDEHTPAPLSLQDGGSWLTAYHDLQQVFNDEDFLLDEEVWVADGNLHAEPNLRSRTGIRSG